MPILDKRAAALLVCSFAACTNRVEERTAGQTAVALELVVQQAVPGTFVAFSPDGRVLATTSLDATTLWETATGRLIRELPPVQRDVVEQNEGQPPATRVAFGSGGQQVVFSPDGRYVAALPLSLKRAMDITDWRSAAAPAVWEVATGRALSSTPWQAGEGNLRNPAVPFSLSELLAWSVVRSDSAARRVVTDLRALRSVSGDGRRAVTIEASRAPFAISIRELPSGNVIARLPEVYDDAALVALSPDAQWLAVRTKGKLVDLWNLPRMEKVETLARGPNVAPRSIAFSADSKLLAIGGSRLQIVRVADCTLLADQPFETALGEGITELAFSGDGSMLAGTGSSLRLFAVPSGSVLREFQMPALSPVVEWAASPTALALARDRPQDEWAGGRDYNTGSIELWPLDSGAPRLLDSALQTVVSMSLSANGRWLAAAMKQPAIVSRYTNVFVGDLSVWSLADAKRHAPINAGVAWPSSNALFARGDSGILAIRLVARQTQRDCSYAECGEDEITEYDGWLDHIDLATRQERRQLRLGRTATDDGEAYLLAPSGDRLLAHDRRGARLTSVSTGTPNVPLASAAIAAWPCERDDCQFRWSASGSLLAITGKHIALVIDGATGALALEHDFQSDTGDVTIRSARFIPGDSAGLAFVVARDGTPGSVLHRLDVRSGDVRVMMRFPDTVDDALFAGANRVLTRTRSIVRVYDAVGTPLAWLTRSTSGRWAVVTPDGLFDAVGGGPELFVWRASSKLVAPSELPARFNVPGLLQRIMRGEKMVAPMWPAGP